MLSSPSTLATLTTVPQLASYVRLRYGYGDFTGIGEENFLTLQACIAAVDALALLFPQTTNPLSGAPDSKFQGIGTVLSAFCPPNIKGQMGDDWGATKWVTLHHPDGSFDRANGPVIWLNPSVFASGSGLLGDIGFIFARTPLEATIHEFGHVVAALTPQAELQLQRAVYHLYGFAIPRQRISLGRDVSIYALGSSSEQYAEIFAVLHVAGGLERLKSQAARTRLRTLARLTNQYLRAGHAGYLLSPAVRGL